MLIFDFARVVGDPTSTAAWIDANRPRVEGLAAGSWERHHRALPSGLDYEQPLMTTLGPAMMANDAIRFNLDWSIQAATGSGAVLAADLTVQPFIDNTSHLELQGSCRELVGWLTEIQNQHARRVMLHCVRSFLVELGDEINGSA